MTRPSRGASSVRIRAGVSVLTSSSTLSWRRRTAAGASRRAQHVHVIDRVRSRRHARDQGRRLQVRAGAALAAGADVLRDQARQPGALGEGHDRDQPGLRHQPVLDGL